MPRSPSRPPRAARSAYPVPVFEPGRPGRLLLFPLALGLAACAAPRPTSGSGVRCPTDRTVTLASQEDVQQFAGCTSARGLTIRTGVALDLAPLRQLHTITGDLSIGPTLALDGVALPELREVGGAIQVASNSLVHGVFLPRLERAGRISVEANAGLTTLSLPRLATVLGSLVIVGNPSLEVVDLSTLAAVDKDLVITDNPRLALIEAAQLRKVLALRVERNQVLPVAQVEALRSQTAPQ